LIIPGLLPATIALFYVVVLTCGWSIAQIRAQGWLPDFPDSNGGHLVTIVTVAKSFSWGLLLNDANILATILMTSLVSILLTATALELSIDKEIDLNRELCAAGAASFFSGMGGGFVGFHSLSMSRLSISLGARSRWAGVTAALLCAVVLWQGAAFVSFVPRFVCGGFLVFLGLIFLWEWVVEAAGKLSRLDYFVVLLILAVVGAVGYPQGVATGVLLSVVLFVHNYSRVDVVSHAMSGADLRSNVDRPVRELKYLREHGEQIFVLHLQGFIFFGTAHHLLQEVRARAADRSLQRLRFVVMDLRRVTGIDSSAVFSLGKVHQLSQRKGFTLVMTHLEPEIQRQLIIDGLPCDHSDSLRVFPDLDHGLEWCEHSVLAGWAERETGERGHLGQLLGDGWPGDISCDGLLDYVEPQKFAKGSYLISQSDQSQNIYVIESGRVTARIELADGRWLRLRTMGPGSIVGEVGMFLGGRRMASVVAEGDCTAYCLSAAALERMRQEQPVLALAFHQFLIRLLAERLTTTSVMLRGFQEQGAQRDGSGKKVARLIKADSMPNGERIGETG
jgi:SulP family sulfate permease